MKVFLSWSGERSRQVAELLDEWLQCVIQAVTPWMSNKDIDRRALWFSEITDQLANTGIGVICLTKENKVKPWILFEAGALAKGISSNRVCTLLIDLKPAIGINWLITIIVGNLINILFKRRLRA